MRREARILFVVLALLVAGFGAYEAGRDWVFWLGMFQLFVVVMEVLMAPPSPPLGPLRDDIGREPPHLHR